MTRIRLVFAVFAFVGCQTYDFEPVQPLALAQETEVTAVISRRAKPNVMLLVDKSGSMNEPTATGTRLSDMKGAMSLFLSEFGTSARFGLSVFPDATAADACGVACVPGKVLHDITPSSDVDAELQAAAATIDAQLQSIGEPGNLPAIGGTPTAASLDVLAGLSSLQDLLREDFVLLLTDGLPNCNTSLDPAACSCTATTSTGQPITPCNFSCNCLDSWKVLESIDALRTKGIRTIVVGFGAETGSSIARPLLNGMATRGGFARTCETDADCGAGDTCEPNEKLCSTRFYQAASAEELAQTLSKIGGRIPGLDPCQYGLTSAPSDSELIAVYLDGERVESGASTWTYSNAGVPLVTFTGETCTRLEAASEAQPVTVEIRIVQAL